MGTWAVDSFGNDAACDWGYGLEEAEDLGYIRQTIEKFMSGDGNEEEAGPEEVIAAVEVVARLKGNFGERNAYTETMDTWVEQHPQLPPADLVKLCVAALDRIMKPGSEIYELWRESDEFEAWKDSVTDLKSRVSR